MANLGRRRGGAEVNSALKNVNSEWKTQTALSLTSGSTQTHKVEWPILTLLVKTDDDILFEFSATSDDIVSSNSLDIKAGSIVEIDVPWGEADDATKDEIYFQVQRINAVTTTVKIVEG